MKKDTKKPVSVPLEPAKIAPQAPQAPQTPQTPQLEKKPANSKTSEISRKSSPRGTEDNFESRKSKMVKIDQKIMEGQPQKIVTDSPVKGEAADRTSDPKPMFAKAQVTPEQLEKNT